MSAILGLNFHHADSAAALVLDGKLVAAVAEERLGRRMKHDPAFPAHAVRAVLAAGGISAKELDCIAVPRDAGANRRAKMAYVLGHPATGVPAALEHWRRARGELGIGAKVAAACGIAPADIRATIVPVEHHLAHIASAYYCSPFDGLTAGFSFDGSGDFTSAMAARCEGTRIEVLARVHLPHSLGFFYTAACQFIGFDQFGEEYKVMGLAPYGTDQYAVFMKRVLRLSSDYWYRLGPGYIGMHSGNASGKLDSAGRIVMGRLYTDRWVAELGMPRIRDSAVTQRDMDLAQSCQARFEEAVMHIMCRLHDLVPTSRLAYAGGCALNGVANARILRATPFQHAYLQAAASDDGLSVGAALWAWHNVAGGKERFHMHHAYWGPSHPTHSLHRCALRAKMPHVDAGDGNIVRLAAQLLRQGLVVGWYQGRSEWGPRALGNRSILADPTIPDMKARINAKIKRREMFRPFAPSVIRPAVSTYFEQDVLSPFMMHVVKLKPQWRERLPAITHVDGTGRLQSIERETNPLYYDLIEHFGALSGIPILLNTSFNENEPVVDTPDQALDCFLRTGLDALCLGTHVVVKPEHARLLESLYRGMAGDDGRRYATA